jgi:hypothetical protein
MIVASKSFNTANFQTALQTCMLADRHALRRKVRDAEDLFKFKDEKSALKARNRAKSASFAAKICCAFGQFT